MRTMVKSIYCISNLFWINILNILSDMLLKFFVICRLKSNLAAWNLANNSIPPLLPIDLVRETLYNYAWTSPPYWGALILSADKLAFNRKRLKHSLTFSICLVALLSIWFFKKIRLEKLKAAVIRFIIVLHKSIIYLHWLLINIKVK